MRAAWLRPQNEQPGGPGAVRPGFTRVVSRDRGAGRGYLRASHADREQAIEMLKAAYVQGMLAKDEFDLRVGQAFASRTYADLAALTTDLPAGLAAAAPARSPAPARRRPMARAAAGSGGCLVIAAAAVWGAGILDPGPFARSTSAPPPRFSFAGPDVCHRPLRRAGGTRLPACRDGQLIGAAPRPRAAAARPGPGGPTLDGEQGGGTGHGPVPPPPAPARTAPT